MDTTLSLCAVFLPDLLLYAVLFSFYFVPDSQTALPCCNLLYNTRHKTLKRTREKYILSYLIYSIILSLKSIFFQKAVTISSPNIQSKLCWCVRLYLKKKHMGFCLSRQKSSSHVESRVQEFRLLKEHEFHTVVTFLSSQHLLVFMVNFTSWKLRGLL